MIKRNLFFVTLFFLFNIYSLEVFYFLENGKKVSFTKLEQKTEKGWPVVLSGNRPLYLNGKITAKVKGGKNIELFEHLVEKMDAGIIRTNCRQDTCYIEIKSPRGSDPFAISDIIRKSRLVEWVHPDWKIKVKLLSISNDPFADLQWHLPMINAPKAWEHTYGEPYSIIAVLDSGISIYHPDLRDNIIRGKSFAKNPSTGVVPLDDAKGPYYNMIAAHGTAVAGIIGAVTDNRIGVAGICGNCSITPAKFFDYHEEYIEVSRTLNAFKWLVDNGAAVINNSWGEIDIDENGKCLEIQPDNFRNEAVQYAAKYGRNGLGSIVVWAAGNSRCDTALNMNYEHPSILLVNAVDEYGKMAEYSNYGNRIDIALPDASVTTDLPGEYGFNNSVFSDNIDLEYTTSFTGTSSSAAVASGIAGLIISANPALTSEEVIKCMKAASMIPEQNCSLEESQRDSLNIPSDPPGKEHSKCFGFGVVDTEKAVKMAIEGSCGEQYTGCTKNDCPIHFICDKESGKCIEDESDPLKRYDTSTKRGCTMLFF